MTTKTKSASSTTYIKIAVLSVVLWPIVILLSTIKAEAEVKEDGSKLKLIWDHPSERENGEKFELSELNYTTVYWDCGSGKGSKQVPAPDSSTTVGIPDRDQRCVYTLTATDNNGLTSKLSEAFVFIGGTTVIPNPPQWSETPEDNATLTESVGQ